jgi:glutamyl-tRNA reductase
MSGPGGEIFGVGTHRRANVSAGGFGFPPEQVRAWLSALRAGGLPEAVVLSTCERLEIYGVGAADVAAAFLQQALGMGSPLALTRWTGSTAVRHLFRVAAGLDSTAVGEPEILGQVREALTLAREAGTVGAILGPLFDRAIALGREVRSRTDLGRFPSSLAALAVQEIRERVGLAGKRILVVGAGTMGSAVVRAVGRDRPLRLRVLSRTLERARQLAEPAGGEAGTLTDLISSLIEADVAFMALAVPQPILSRPELHAVAHGRGAAPADPLWLVDLGAPPNVDPQAELPPSIHRIGLEDLQARGNARRQRLEAAIAQAEAMVEAAVREWEAAQRSRAVGPLIARLERRAEAIRQQELAWLWPKLGELTPAQRARIEQFAHRLVRKLLHAPFIGLKQAAGDPQALALFQALWQLEDDPFSSDGGASP